MERLTCDPEIVMEDSVKYDAFGRVVADPPEEKKFSRVVADTPEEKKVALRVAGEGDDDGDGDGKVALDKGDVKVTLTNGDFGRVENEKKKDFAELGAHEEDLVEGDGDRKGDVKVTLTDGDFGRVENQKKKVVVAFSAVVSHEEDHGDLKVTLKDGDFGRVKTQKEDSALDADSVKVKGNGDGKVDGKIMLTGGDAFKEYDGLGRVVDAAGLGEVVIEGCGNEVGDVVSNDLVAVVRNYTTLTTVKKVVGKKVAEKSEIPDIEDLYTDRAAKLVDVEVVDDVTNEDSEDKEKKM